MTRRLPTISALAFALALAAAVFAGGCNTVPKSAADQDVLLAEADATLAKLDELNPQLASGLKGAAAGYAVFPKVGKGAFIVGGGFGRGVLYENDAAVGFASISHMSVGLQAGGQAFSEVIYFEPEALERFKLGKFALDAKASAVAATANVSNPKMYSDGTAIVTFRGRGLMAEAAVGGQKFDYVPMSVAEEATAPPAE